jgi:hypothetical protein
MKIGQSIRDLQDQIAKMEASDPEGYKRVTRVHHETFSDPDDPRLTRTRVTGVELDDLPQVHAVDLTKGPWRVSA